MGGVFVRHEIPLHSVGVAEITRLHGHKYKKTFVPLILMISSILAPELQTSKRLGVVINDTVHKPDCGSLALLQCLRAPCHLYRLSVICICRFSIIIIKAIISSKVHIRRPKHNLLVCCCKEIVSRAKRNDSSLSLPGNLM